MKKRTTLFLLLLSFHFAAFSQIETSLMGKWIFKDVANKEKMDAASLDMLKQFFGSFSIDLNTDHHFKMMVMTKEEQGTWNYSEADKKLTLTPGKGNPSSMTVSLRDTSTMEFGLDKSKVLLLQKASPGVADNAGSISKPQTLATASSEQICRKWYFQGREKPNTSKEILEMSNKMFKGTFFEFSNNKTYYLKMGSIEENGAWALENGNTTLALSAEDNKKYWQIKSISNTTLVLIKANTEEAWTFTTTL